MSGSVTKKYCPGSKSTSSPRRSKVTNSVPFATSRFSLIVARILLSRPLFATVAASDSVFLVANVSDGVDTSLTQRHQDRHRGYRGNDPTHERGRASRLRRMSATDRQDGLG